MLVTGWPPCSVHCSHTSSAPLRTFPVDESARATGRREQLHVLAPANEPQGGNVSGGGSDDSVDLAAALLAGVSLRPEKLVCTCHRYVHHYPYVHPAVDKQQDAELWHSI